MTPPPPARPRRALLAILVAAAAAQLGRTVAPCKALSATTGGGIKRRELAAEAAEGAPAVADGREEEVGGEDGADLPLVPSWAGSGHGPTTIGQVPSPRPGPSRRPQRSPVWRLLLGQQRCGGRRGTPLLSRRVAGPPTPPPLAARRRGKSDDAPGSLKSSQAAAVPSADLSTVAAHGRGDVAVVDNWSRLEEEDAAQEERLRRQDLAFQELADEPAQPPQDIAPAGEADEDGGSRGVLPHISRFWDELAMEDGDIEESVRGSFDEQEYSRLSQLQTAKVANMVGNLDRAERLSPRDYARPLRGLLRRWSSAPRREPAPRP